MDSRDTKRSSKPVSQAGYNLTRLDYVKLIKERKLSRVQRYVTGGGTELPFTGRTSNGFSYKNKRRGVYHCAVCELPAYSSKHKFDSGTGWPSFFKAIDPDHIRETTDVSLGMVRKEVLCARCHAHQGHVFRDGPQPTGLRYCINTASLTFKPAKGGNQDPPHSMIGRFFRSLSRLITPNKEDEEPASTPQTDMTSTETDEKKLQGDH